MNICAAIDFGTSNVDAVASIHGVLHYWTQPTEDLPSPQTIRATLAAGGLTLSQLRQLAVTGGHHHLLPHTLEGCPIVHISEVNAIARGGQALLALEERQHPLLIVSAGSGVALVAARGNEYFHVTGTGVGGGTLRGLGQLVLGTGDPHELDRLAQAGDPNAVDLTLLDVVSGPIGGLPSDTTAVNFGRVPRLTSPPRPADVAAALVTLVAQGVGTIAVNAARAERIDRVIITGHMTDMPSLRAALIRTGSFFGFTFIIPAHGGRATALGALEISAHNRNDHCMI